MKSDTELNKIVLTGLILPSEGGKVDDPRDRGGRTNQGVTQRTYNAWRQRQGLRLRDVWDMEDHERDAIYREDYYDKCWADRLPAPVAAFAYDAAVQHGPKTARKLLQRCVKADDDGLWGPETRGCLKSYSPLEVLARYAAARLRFYADIPGDRYDDGWMNRSADALMFSSGLECNGWPF